MDEEDKQILGKVLTTWGTVQYFACNEWSITKTDIEKDLSDKELNSADAALLAGVIHGNKALRSLDLGQNKLNQRIRETGAYFVGAKHVEEDGTGN